jgi:NDP-sugar pyrophosphorylase family protein
MGGLGTRFSGAGYSEPKPFLPLLGKQMIEIVVENLLWSSTSKVVLVVRVDHSDRMLALRPALENLIATKSRATLAVVTLEEVSDGPADSVLQAKDLLDPNEGLIIANSDQFVIGGIEELYKHMGGNPGENALLALNDTDSKWSFVKVDDEDYVIELREKKPISDLATAGIYGFSSSRDFFDGLAAMYAASDRTNGEFYVGPVYNYVQSKTKALRLGPNQSRFYGLGTPVDYEVFRERYEDKTN